MSYVRSIYVLCLRGHKAFYINNMNIEAQGTQYEHTNSRTQGALCKV